MIPGIDPTVDYVFKKLFGSEINTPLLMSLLDAVLKPSPDRRIVSLEITNPFNDKETPDDKLSIVDIKARDQLGRVYNIEMQMVGDRHFLQRVLFYWAVLYGQQLREGDDYVDLRETISICFVNSVLFPQVTDFHLDFQLRCSRHPELIFSDKQSMHVVELPKFGRHAEELTDPLDVWCYFLVHGAALDPDNLPDALRKPAMERAMEVLNIMSQSELERERYQARVKVARDERRLCATCDARELLQRAMEEGLKAKEETLKAKEETLKAKEEAQQRGLEKGIKEGVADRILLLQRLLRLPLTPRAQLLAQALDVLRVTADTLEQQVGVPKIDPGEPEA